jgi:hypothetical protein
MKRMKKTIRHTDDEIESHREDIAQREEIV